MPNLPSVILLNFQDKLHVWVRAVMSIEEEGYDTKGKGFADMRQMYLLGKHLSIL